MSDDTCEGEIWEGDPITPNCQCFKERAPIFKVDGHYGATLVLATEGENTLTQFESSKTIDPNPARLKICRWKQRGLLRAGLKSNCADVGLEFVMDIGHVYPLELGQTLVRKRLRWRSKYADVPTSLIFPFSGTWTFNQYVLEGGVPTPQTPMTLTMSDLTVTIELEDPCISDATLWSATFSDDQATNDAGFQDPTTWDPNGATFNNESVHADGRVGIGWRFYNTLVRFGEVTYGPTVFATFQKVDYGGNEDTAYGFTTIEDTVIYP